jgi:hypothetical protein
VDWKAWIDHFPGSGNTSSRAVPPLRTGWTLQVLRHHSRVSPEFVFAIALKPKSVSSDWQRVLDNLRRTIRSAHACDPAAAVIVACHDEPELGDAAEGVVSLCVPFPEPSSPGEGGRDKAAKRRHAGAWLRESMSDGDAAYVMFLDADDLVHRDLVTHVRSRREPSYVARSGYIADLERGLLGLRRTNFHQTCGSSFVFRFARAELPVSWDDLSAPFSQFGSSPDQRGHPEYDAVARDLGRPPVAFPFPAVTYVVNHAESLWRAKGRGRRPVGAFQDLVPPHRARRILRDDFGAEDLAEALAGYRSFGGTVLGAATSRAQARLARQLKADRS